MTTIVSKRHSLKFYLPIILATLFFIALATGFLFAHNKLLDRRRAKTKEIFMPIFSIGCFAFAGYGLYRYVKNAPQISLNRDSITFNNQLFSLSEIKQIILSGKQPFKYAIDFPREAATLTFNNGVTKYIFDDMYTNSLEIKSFLKQVLADKKKLSKCENPNINVKKDPDDHNGENENQEYNSQE
jgi:hypothetical protein